MTTPTLEEVTNALKNAHAAGDTAAAQKLAIVAQQIQGNPVDVISFDSKEREMEDFSAIERFKYEFATEESFAENAGIYLEAISPFGNIDLFGTAGKGLYASPTELYGQDFMELNIDERRQRIQQVRYEKQKEVYPELTRLEEEGEGTGAAGFVGAVGKAILDPTTLLPAGKSLPAMAAISGLVTGSYEAARGLAEEGEIDPLMTSVYAASGAVLAPALAKTVSAIAPAFNKMQSKIGRKRTVKDAEEAEIMVSQINSKMMELKEEGIPDEGLLLAASQRLQLNGDKMQDAIAKSSVKLDIPWNQDVNKVVLETAQSLSGSGVKNGMASQIASTTIRKIRQFSPAIAQRIQKYEMDSSVLTAEYKKNVAPFVSLFSKLPNEVKTEFTKRLMNGQYPSAAQLAKDSGIDSFQVNGLFEKKVVSNVDDAMKGLADTLNKLHNYTQDGVKGGVPFVSNYFPRVVTKYQELINALGIKEDALFNTQLKQKAKALDITVDELTEGQRIDVLNSMFSGSGKYLPSGPSFTKKRVIDEVNDDLMEYYSGDAASNILKYIDRTVNHVEKHKLFTQNGVLKNADFDINLRSSIGGLVEKLQKEGNFKGSVSELTDILEVRFGAGELSPDQFFQSLRNITSTVLLGNPGSALIQLGDQFVNIYRYGGDGGRAIIENVLGRSVANVDDFGLKNFVSTDIKTGREAAGFLQNKISPKIPSTRQVQTQFFKYSGFSAVDRFGKNTLLQAAFNKGTRLAKSDSGIKELRKKYGEGFGDGFDSFVSDLNAGKVSEDVKLYLWSELSGSQPISKSDMPQQYLKMKNGRMLYQLKSFAIKQIQLLNDTVVDEARKGNFAEAGKNALAYTVIVGGGNAAVQELRNAGKGRNFDIKRIPENVGNYLLSTALSSKYALDNFMDGNFSEGLTSMTKPPFMVVADAIDDAYDVVSSVFEGESVNPKDLRRIPGFGDFYYNMFGGGAEEFLEKERKERVRR